MTTIFLKRIEKLFKEKHFKQIEFEIDCLNEKDKKTLRFEWVKDRSFIKYLNTIVLRYIFIVKFTNTYKIKMTFL